MRKKLLIVDDNEAVREATRFAFEAAFDVYDASGGEEALRQFDSACPDVVFLDLELGGIPEGRDILMKIRDKNPDVVILIISGSASAKSDPLMMKADGFFEKPARLSEIQSLLKKKKLL